MMVRVVVLDFERCLVMRNGLVGVAGCLVPQGLGPVPLQVHERGASWKAAELGGLGAEAVGAAQYRRLPAGPGAILQAHAELVLRVGQEVRELPLGRVWLEQQHERGAPAGPAEPDRVHGRPGAARAQVQRAPPDGRRRALALRLGRLQRWRPDLVDHAHGQGLPDGTDDATLGGTEEPQLELPRQALRGALTAVRPQQRGHGDLDAARVSQGAAGLVAGQVGPQVGVHHAEGLLAEVESAPAGRRELQPARHEPDERGVPERLLLQRPGGRLPLVLEHLVLRVPEAGAAVQAEPHHARLAGVEAVRRRGQHVPDVEEERAGSGEVPGEEAAARLLHPRRAPLHDGGGSGRIPLEAALANLLVHSPDARVLDFLGAPHQRGGVPQLAEPRAQLGLVGRLLAVLQQGLPRHARVSPPGSLQHQHPGAQGGIILVYVGVQAPDRVDGQDPQEGVHVGALEVGVLCWRTPLACGARAPGDAEAARDVLGGQVQRFPIAQVLEQQRPVHRPVEPRLPEAVLHLQVRRQGHQREARGRGERQLLLELPGLDLAVPVRVQRGEDELRELGGVGARSARVRAGRVLALLAVARVLDEARDLAQRETLALVQVEALEEVVGARRGPVHQLPEAHQREELVHGDVEGLAQPQDTGGARGAHILQDRKGVEQVFRFRHTERGLHAGGFGARVGTKEPLRAHATP
mmetsp:Transcript_47991/g.137234  ORF Transcript_47991/g.137234 Transcript_47991/m.137234 type:complete len:694 (-) Transcript_47991:583-2664(-)